MAGWPVATTVVTCCPSRPSKLEPTAITKLSDQLDEKRCTLYLFFYALTTMSVLNIRKLHYDDIIVSAQGLSRIVLFRSIRITNALLVLIMQDIGKKGEEKEGIWKRRRQTGSTFTVIRYVTPLHRCPRNSNEIEVLTCGLLNTGNL